MQIKVGQTQEIIYTSGSYDGVEILAWLNGAVNDVALGTAAYKPQMLTVMVELHRNGQVHQIANHNGLLLGTYSTRKNQYEWFLNGLLLRAKDTVVKEQKLRFFHLDFGSVVRVGDKDRLVVTCTANDGIFSSDVDTSLSYIDFRCTPAIGYEIGIPRIRFEVVQTNADSNTFINADGIIKAEFLNFDKQSFDSPVIAGVNFSSDLLNYGVSLYQLYADNQRKFPKNIPYRFGTSLPINPSSPSVSRAQDWLPQSQTLFERAGSFVVLNKVAANIQFNSANVAASQNWVGSTSLYIDPATAQRTIERIARHNRENVAKVLGGA